MMMPFVREASLKVSGAISDVILVIDEGFDPSDATCMGENM